jgi:hypothetical protein
MGAQFRQDPFGIPEDGAPEAPKHVVDILNIRSTFKNAFRLFFFHHTPHTRTENAIILNVPSQY